MGGSGFARRVSRSISTIVQGPTRDANAVAEDALREYIGTASDIADRRCNLDLARPTQLFEKIDLDPRQHGRCPGNLQALVGIEDDADAAGFQVGRVDRIVDVAL